MTGLRRLLDAAASVLDSARRRRISVYCPAGTVISRCAGHGGLFSYDPATVTTALIDPATGDGPGAGDPAAWQRARRAVYCPACTAGIGAIAARERRTAGWRMIGPGGG